MSATRYKTPSFQKMYDAMLAAAQDPSSELYSNGLPHRGAGHRCAFWDGYGGVRSPMNAPMTLSSVCYQAGKAFKKINPAIAHENAVWITGINRQGEKLPDHIQPK